MQTLPHDLVAEESLIGAMLLSPEAIMVASDILVPGDFYSALNGQIFYKIQELDKRNVLIDPVIITSELNDPSISARLSSAMINCPSPNGAANYADIIYRHSVARKIIQGLQTATTEIIEGSSPFEVSEKTEKFLAGAGNIRTNEPEALTLSELSARAESIAPEVIPGMMNLDYRTIVVAEEGSGKSLLLRTVAMCASQGFHPFSHRRIEPVRALIVDLENPAQAILQTAEPFMGFLEGRDRINGENLFDETRLKIWRRPAGIEIRSLSDRAELQREIAAHRPQLVCIGPIYKMYRRGSNESYEDSADEAMAVLDELRIKYGFALLMEHHAAKGKPGERRELSPMGSQRWMAWPEVGISLYKDPRDPTVLQVKRYRGDRLQGVDWPDKIMRDRHWLIEGSWDAGT